MAARAAGGLAQVWDVRACGGSGSGGLWYGPRCFLLPSRNPAAPNLLNVQLEAEGGRVQSLAVQGRNVPLVQPFSAASAALLAPTLDRMGMCVGVVDEAKVEYAAGARHLQGRVQHGFDGQGCHEWNEVVRQGAAFQVAAKTASGGGKRWRSSLHAASAAATRTVRAGGCTRYVLFAAGEPFQPNCDACNNFDRNTLAPAVARQEAAAELQEKDPAKAAEAKRRKLGPGSNERYMQEEEIREKREATSAKVAALQRRVMLLEKAAAKREAEGVSLGKDVDGALGPEDYDLIKS
eukprot:COSAG01_NODE_19976_length_978_cov_2.126280_1_plen_293_part_01